MTLSALAVAVAALATYRVTQFLVYDTGPWEIMERVRRAAGSGELGKLLVCPYCTGVWVALAATAALFVDHWLVNAILLWLGLAGAQAWLESHERGS